MSEFGRTLERCTKEEGNINKGGSTDKDKKTDIAELVVMTRERSGGTCTHRKQNFKRSKEPDSPVCNNHTSIITPPSLNHQLSTTPFSRPQSSSFHQSKSTPQPPVHPPQSPTSHHSFQPHPPSTTSAAIEDESQTCNKNTKKIAAFFFSHMGLAVMVMSYSVMGGLLFQALEGSEELQEKDRVRFLREDTAGEIMQLALHLNIHSLDQNNFAQLIREALSRYQVRMGGG